MLAALSKLRALLTEDGRDTALQQLAGPRGDWPELWGVWDAQKSAKSGPVIAALLHTLTTLFLVGRNPPKLPRPVQDANAAQACSAPLEATLNALAETLLSQQLKSLYFHLSSGDHVRANSTLRLLTAAVARSPHHASLFLANFDTSLAALATLALPSKGPSKGGAASSKGGAAARSKQRAQHTAASAESAKHTGDESTEAGGVTVSPTAAAWKRWDSSKVAKQPSRACFCRLVLALLDSGLEGLALAPVLQTWPLVGPLLNHLALDPPAHVERVCATLFRRVVSPGTHLRTPSAVCSSFCSTRSSLLFLYRRNAYSLLAHVNGRQSLLASHVCVGIH